jgi:putative ABC transport system substrate-binding protein
LQAAALTLGAQLHILHASSERDFDAVFTTLSELRPSGLVFASDTLFGTHGEQLAALTIRHAVPAIHLLRSFCFAMARSIALVAATMVPLPRRAAHNI